MTKLKFTKKHAGWFIILTFVGTMAGILTMIPGQILSSTLSVLAPVFAFVVILGLVIVATDWVTDKP